MSNIVNCTVVCCALNLISAMEVKQPFRPDEELKLQEDHRSIAVSGQTFTYSFDKGNGLITSIQVLGRRINTEEVIPDLWVAEHLDENHHVFAASRERSAEVRVISVGPAQVRILSTGRYTDEDGRKFPLQYTVSYDISIDGVVLVQVNNTAQEDCAFRWLTLSGGSVRPEHARFLNWMPDQAASQSTRYSFRSLAGAVDGKLLSGVWIPWIWVGDQNRGLEVTTWEVGSQTYNRVDSTQRDDEPDMFVVRKEPDRVQWQNFLVRRTLVFARKGWQRGGGFALAVTPSKRFDSSYALLKGAHLGPHQHEETLALPDEESIRTLAQHGYNLVVGMANWRSGEYVPLNDAELRRVIEQCHRFGMKIIPYVTLVDLAHATETFRTHGEEWAIEPTTEFDRVAAYAFTDPAKERAYRNDFEQQTTLMCPGAPEWRKHWKAQIDRILTDYDFDGLYIDFWYGRMVCENTRHGCGGRFRRHTVLGSRDMLAYAYNRIRQKNPRGILKANTNTLATALITSLVDIRLVGESLDMAEMDPASREWLYSSIRLGQPTEFLWDQTRWTPSRMAGFAALVNFLPKYYERPRLRGRDRQFDDFDVYRSFDAGKGEWRLGISGESPLGIEPPEVAVNTVEREDERLATVVNPTGQPVSATFTIGDGAVVYEPLSENRLVPSEGVCRLDLAAGAYRHLLWLKTPDHPRLLWALGASGGSSTRWEPQAGRLVLSVPAVEGARIRFGVYCTAPPKEVSTDDGAQVPFQWEGDRHLARFELSHRLDRSVTVRF